MGKVFFLVLTALSIQFIIAGGIVGLELLRNDEGGCNELLMGVKLAVVIF